jgi:hypothetical protein
VKLKGIGIFLCFVFSLMCPSMAWSQQSHCESGDLGVCQCVDFQENSLNQARQLVASKQLVAAANWLEGVLMRCPDAESVFVYYRWLLSQLTNLEVFQSGSDGLALSNSDWRVIKRLGVLGGYSDNLFRAPTQSTIIWNGLSLEPSSDFKLQDGFTSLMDVGGSAYKKLSSASDWYLSADLISRLSGEGGFADYQQLFVQSTFNYGLGTALEHGVTAGFNMLRYQNDQYYAVSELQFEQRWRIHKACHLISGESFSWQRQVGLAVMDSYMAALRGGLSCLSDDVLYQLVLTTGGDWGDGRRPGGTRWRNQVQASALWRMDRLRKGSVFRAIGRFAQVNDGQKYSSFLGDDNRQVQHFLLKGSFQWPIVQDQGGLLSGQIDVGWQKEHANMALFGVDFIELWGGVNFKW